MTACWLGVALLAACPEPSAPAAVPVLTVEAPRADPWLGQDKARHFGMSFAATLFTYAAARAVMGPEPAAVTAGATALTLGIGKEIHDVRGGGRFSLRDLAWDAAGVALGLALAQRIR